MGSVDNYTRRVIAALCRLTDRFIRWPDAEERNAIKRRIGGDSIFFNCVGFLDGSLIPLAYKPTMHAFSDFHNRKERYGLNILAVCDDRKRFTYVRLGAAGSTHDQVVIDSSDVSYFQLIVLSSLTLSVR